MGDLITKSLENKDELKNVNGFCVVKVEKYGDEMLRIIKIDNL